MSTPKVLVTVLNWGLGHATRCVPLVQCLRALGHTPVLASDGRALKLLAKEFPDLETRTLPAYDVHYTGNMLISMLRQTPKILRAVRAEQKVVRRWIHQEEFTHLISDNRYGCYASNIRTAFLTHQINIAVPNRLFAGVNWINRGFLRKYDEVWVPDHAPGPKSLSGKLALPRANLPPVKYLGPLSRFSPYSEEPEYDLTAVVSGPEPTRSLFAKRLHRALSCFPGKTALVLGQPEARGTDSLPTDGPTVFPFLDATDLNQLLNRSRCVVSRSGYSSIMDYAALGIPAILIPTPGQTEQEYLAQRFARTGRFVVPPSTDLDLPPLFQRAISLNRRRTDPVSANLSPVLKDFLE